MKRAVVAVGLLLATMVAFVGMAQAQIPPLTVPTSTTTAPEPATTTTSPSETTTTFTSLEPVPGSDLPIAEPPLADVPVVSSTTTAIPTTVVRTVPAAASSSVASAITGAFGVAIATVMAVAGIFVSLSIRSRARR